MILEVVGNGNALRLRGYRRGRVGGCVSGNRRGSIVGFSKASRRRMILSIRALDFERLKRDGYFCYFATGTYQRDLFVEYGDLYKLKKHIDNLRRAFVRVYPEGFFFWKLEFHKSGVPHVHFLFFVRVDWVDFMRWFSRVWVDTISVYGFPRGDSRVYAMYRVATNVRIVRMDMHEVVSVYTVKEVGKVIQTGSVGWTGRFWGIANRKVYKQYVSIEKFLIGERDFYRLRRLLRSYLRSKGYGMRVRYRMQGICLLFTHLGFIKQVCHWVGLDKLEPLDYDF